MKKIIVTFENSLKCYEAFMLRFEQKMLVLSDRIF